MANPGTPVLNSPVGGIRVTDNTPTLSFVIPSDADNDNLVFRVELDTNNPINISSSDYKKFESRLGEGSWQYWAGGTYVDMPTAGIGSSAYGSDAVFTIPNTGRLRNATWYWKVCVSDELGCCTFDNGIFGQKKFCAGA